MDGGSIKAFMPEESADRSECERMFLPSCSTHNDGSGRQHYRDEVGMTGGLKYGDDEKCALQLGNVWTWGLMRHLEQRHNLDLRVY